MDRNDEIALNDRKSLRMVRRVTWLGFGVNAALGVLKVAAGILGRSSAMVADGIHSFSDFISDIIVLVFVGISRRKANMEFQYGHGKFETFATMLLALVLGIVGVMFFMEGGEKVWWSLHGAELEQPGWIALIMALLSIASKEWLYRITRKVGEKVHSAVVVANAWHHRSDSLSSLATLAGIGGAMFLGARWRILDPVAAMVVSVFIIIVAVKLGKPAVAELLERSLPSDLVEGMYSVIGHTDGVRAFHHFASRYNGNRIFVDFHIKVDPDISVVSGHHIASQVEGRLQDAYGENVTATIHVEPYMGQPVDRNNMCS